ncbi:hypothetical protein HAX54_011197, partial [Datura stramonium]|nr:hypothetical protein [Datura stramonium]
QSPHSLQWTRYGNQRLIMARPGILLIPTVVELLPLWWSRCSDAILTSSSVDGLRFQNRRDQGKRWRRSIKDAAEDKKLILYSTKRPHPPQKLTENQGIKRGILRL